MMKQVQKGKLGKSDIIWEGGMKGQTRDNSKISFEKPGILSALAEG